MGKKPVSETDYVSFRKVEEVLALLNGGSRVVVHCQAGCHRTGIFCHVILRTAGFSPEDSFSAIRRTREVTWSELTAITKKRPAGLQPKAEGIFEALCNAGTSKRSDEAKTFRGEDQERRLTKAQRRRL